MISCHREAALTALKNFHQIRDRGMIDIFLLLLQFDGVMTVKLNCCTKRLEVLAYA